MFLFLTRALRRRWHVLQGCTNVNDFVLNFFIVSGIKINCLSVKMNFGAIAVFMFSALAVSRGKSAHMRSHEPSDVTYQNWSSTVEIGNRSSAGTYQCLMTLFSDGPSLVWELCSNQIFGRIHTASFGWQWEGLIWRGNFTEDARKLKIFSVLYWTLVSLQCLACWLNLHG